jgi:hypothetical protein
MTRMIRFSRPRKPAEPPHPLMQLFEPIVPDEITGQWSIWHEGEGFPSYAFARAVWERGNGRNLSRFTGAAT